MKESRRLLGLVRSVAPYAAVAVVAVALAFTRPDWEIAMWSQAAAFAVIILGLNVVVGHSGQFSLCQSAFAGTGAYLTVILAVDHGWSFVPTLPVSAVVGFVLGFVVGLPALRIKGHYLTMFTLGLAVSFPPLIRRFPELTGGANGKIMVLQWPVPAWMPASLSQPGWIFLVIVVFAILLFAGTHNLVTSRVGDALRVTRTNDLVACSVGVDPARARVLAFAVSGALGALGGSLLALATGVVSPESFGLFPALLIATGLILGGVGRVAGSAIGGLAVVFLPYWTADVTSGPAANVVYGLILIVLMFVAPGGLVSIAGRLRGRFTAKRRGLESATAA